MTMTREEFEELNWYKRIEVLKGLRGKEDDAGLRKYATYLSQDWTTCACGENEPFLDIQAYKGRGFGFGFGRPAYDMLYRLGLNFHESIESWCYDYALDELKAIQSRAAQCIAQLAKDPSVLKPEYQTMLAEYLAKHPLT